MKINPIEIVDVVVGECGKGGGYRGVDETS
jgi:hypothetical protein